MILARLLLFLLVLSWHLNSRAQPLNIDFTQKNHYPVNWEGDTTKFVRRIGYLQSNSAVVNDQFKVMRKIGLKSPFQFDIELELRLNTSSLNYLEIVLYGVQDDSMSLHLRLGGSKDDLRLLLKNNSQEELLIDGPDKMSEQTHLNIRLVHASDSILYLFHKHIDSSNYIKYGRASTQGITFYRLELSIKQSSQSFHKKHFIHHVYAGDILKDTIAPRFINASSIGKREWLIEFSEPIDAHSVQLTVDGKPLPFFQINSSSISLLFQKTIAEGWYDLHITGVKDTTGNQLKDTSFQFLHYLSKPIPHNGIVINEILADPIAGGFDFIELYNNSDSFYELNDLMIGRIYNSQIEDQTALSPIKMSFPPYSYLLLSENSSSICAQYPCPSPPLAIQIDMPQMNNDSGELILFDSTHTIDSLHYKNNWHTELLLNTEGVSLERINPDGQSNDANNWHSATSLSGFATPAAQNSMFHKKGTSTGFSLQNRLITPNGDGIQDLLLLDFSFDKPSYLSSYIYNLNGVMIWQWHNNELLSFNGTLKWDLYHLNGLLPDGHYIIFLKAFNLDGELIKKKLPFTVASRY